MFRALLKMKLTKERKIKDGQSEDRDDENEFCST